MRLVGTATPEPARFTLSGTLLVLAVGAGWGGVTALLLPLLAGPTLRDRWWLGPAFGAAVLVLAALALLVAISGEGRLVAPAGFIVASSVLFPALFLGHGAATLWLTRRWSRR